MTRNEAYISLHDRRIRLAADALIAHSELDDKAALAAAAHVVYALDHIPEKVR